MKKVRLKMIPPPDCPSPAGGGMNLWLFKTDPDTYAWNDLVKAKREVWNGVSNNLALKYLRSIRKGDQIFVYHSGLDKAIVGIANAVSNPYPDPSKKDSKSAVIDITPIEKLRRPVPLSEIKSDPKLKSWELVRLSRLSVMPATEAQGKEVLRLSQD